MMATINKNKEKVKKDTINQSYVQKLKAYYDETAKKRLKWKKRNRLYHRLLEKYYRFIIPDNSKVLEIGCGTGELLDAVKPIYGVGIDYSKEMVNIAKEQFPNLNFHVSEAENINIDEKFDYIILSDLVGTLVDVQKVFDELKKVSHPRTKIVLNYYSHLWEPILRFSETIGLKSKTPIQNWLSPGDINNLLDLTDWEVIKTYHKILLPKNIPILSYLFNNILVNLPFFRNFCLTNIDVARPKVATEKELSVSIVVPARNEKGNIENAILKTPDFGKWQEFIFIEGNSSDNTYEEMLRVQKAYPEKKIVVTKQTGKGKGNAVREAFDIATGDVLMILDADLTTPPEDMPKFYEALRTNKGEFINGCRLVYPMEGEAMRFLNLLGNKFFSWFFTFLLDQRLKDTLCGTKVLRKSDYDIIAANRHYFGDFDPFGDFDLIFGASKMNLKIAEIPVRYRDREYGSTQISRWSHGWLLIQMSLFAAKKIKFI